MAQKRDGTQLTDRFRSPSPEYYVDLTIDSPLNLRTKLPARRSHRRNDGEAKSSQNAPLQAGEVDGAGCFNRDVPPKKRRRKNKSAKVKAIEDLDETRKNAPSSDVPRIKDAVTDDTHVLSCPICLEYLISSRKPTSTPCGHLYCSDCIKQILVTSNKCPKCQLVIKQELCTRLYL